MNKTLGNRFERELFELLAENGFWAHNLAQNHAGQPADVIAVKNDIAVLIDCKVCSNNRFPLSRIECNQEMAMRIWWKRKNHHGFFALKLTTGEIYMAAFPFLMLARQVGVKCLSAQHIRDELPTFQEWLGVYG